MQCPLKRVALLRGHDKLESVRNRGDAEDGRSRTVRLHCLAQAVGPAQRVRLMPGVEQHHGTPHLCVDELDVLLRGAQAPLVEPHAEVEEPEARRLARQLVVAKKALESIDQCYHLRSARAAHDDGRRADDLRALGLQLLAVRVPFVVLAAPLLKEVPGHVPVEHARARVGVSKATRRVKVGRRVQELLGRVGG